MKVVTEYLSGNIGLKSLVEKYNMKSTKQIVTWVNTYKH